MAIPRSIFGSTAIVTGADSNLGFAIVERLSREGANIVVHVRDDARSFQLKRLGATKMLAGSPALKQVALATVAAAEDAFGPVNLLVTCHEKPTVAPLLDMSVDVFWSHINAGLLGNSFFVQAAAASMIQAGWGRIVLTTSAWAEGGRSLAAVAASAGGINILCKTAASELGSHNISVNVVSSAFINDEWRICDAAALNNNLLPPLLGDCVNVAECVRLFCEPRIGAAVAQTVQCSGGYFRHRI